MLLAYLESNYVNSPKAVIMNKIQDLIYTTHMDTSKDKMKFDYNTLCGQTIRKKNRSVFSFLL